MTKLRASAIHLALSLVIFCAFLGVMFLRWYPSPYFAADGGWTVLRILIGVDLVLGPLLTLVVFKPGKAGLKFDLSCIALLQIAALIYGAMVIYQQRPAFAVFVVDRFTTVGANDIDTSKLKYDELKHPDHGGPQLAIVHKPADPTLAQKIMFEAFAGGKDLDRYPELYEPYRPKIEELKAHNLDLQAFVAASSKAKAALDTFLSRQGGSAQDYLFLPLNGRSNDLVIVLSSKDGMPVGSLNISPWLSDYQRTD
ncbi:MAG: TfpX/TfpZ family type IV pilin accessory protein [Gammaproteobacteria bacterium]